LQEFRAAAKSTDVSTKLRRRPAAAVLVNMTKLMKQNPRENGVVIFASSNRHPDEALSASALHEASQIFWHLPSGSVRCPAESNILEFLKNARVVTVVGGVQNYECNAILFTQRGCQLVAQLSTRGIGS
jgi:hypothetical protein